MPAVIDGAWLLCLHMCLYVGVGWRVGYKTRKSHVKEREVGKKDESLKTGRSLLGGVGRGWREEGRRSKTKYV